MNVFAFEKRVNLGANGRMRWAEYVFPPFINGSPNSQCNLFGDSEGLVNVKK